MINTILTVIAIICLAIWTYFSVRQERKFNEMYNAIISIRDKNDEKIMEYVEYTVKALKNNQTVLNYSAWNIK